MFAEVLGVGGMPAFIVATVNVTDPERFALYGKAIAGLGERFGGEYLVRGGVVDVLEGVSPVGERVVVTKFPTEEAARAFIACDEYQAAKAGRIGAADVAMRLVVS